MEIVYEDSETQRVVPEFPFFGGLYYRGKITYFSEELLRDAQAVVVTMHDFERLNSMQFDCPESEIESVYYGIDTPISPGNEPTGPMRDFFFLLLKEALQPLDHFKRLSARLASIWRFRACTTLSQSEIASSSLEIIARMPSVPMGTLDGVVGEALFDDCFDESSKSASHIIHVPDPWLDRFLLSGYLEQRANIPNIPADPAGLTRWQLYRIQIWQNLEVTRLYDATMLNLIQSAAEMTSTSVFSKEFGQNLYQYVEFLSRMNDEAIKWDREATDFLFRRRYRRNVGLPELEQHMPNEILETNDKALVVGRLVVRCFLWTVWQRATTLLFYLVLNASMLGEERYDWISFLSVGGYLLMENVSLELDEAKDEMTSLSYMCNWGFELLRTSRTSLTLDFRILFRRFVDHFGSIPARCIRDGEGSRRCDGNAATNCQRFVDSGCKNQSMHDRFCDERDCSLISWDRKSYTTTPSPRAVVVDQDQSPTGRLQYRQATGNTLAITHVWSHGQGGRPEEGINICLYRRYCRLAKHYGCDTFWIDSACIPEERALRAEAISNINTIFRAAKVTLICDQDLMSCPIGNRDISIRELETLVSAWLVSDWSVRAWTLLEGVRGAQRLEILCAEDKVLNARDLVTRLMRKGSIALATLSLAALPFLSTSIRPERETKPSFELAGSFLAHRHATRVGDLPKIWSLLCGEVVFSSMEPFLEHVGSVKTGFLVSSAPRLPTHGFRWAPSSPNLKSIDKRNRDIPILRGYHSYDGGGSVQGVVTPRGLRAKWLIWELTRETCPPRMYIGYDGPLLSTYLEAGKSVALLQAISVNGGPYQASAGRGDNQTVDHPLIVLCHREGENNWVWDEVFLFRFGVASEKYFEARDILLV